jgi:hypothetical protein
MPAHHSLGSVIDDRGWDAAEVDERPAVTIPEAAQVLSGREAAERVTRIRQGHVEAVGVQRPGRGHKLAFVAPVDLSLGPRQDLEAAVEADRLRVGVGQPSPVLPDIDLDPLVVAAKAVLGDQPFMDHRGLQPGLLGQPCIDQVSVRVDHAPTRSAPGRHRRCGRRVRRQVALDGAPVTAGLPGDLGPGRPGVGQGLERTEVHPPLLREDHELPSSGSAGWSLPTGGWPHDRRTGTLALTPTYTSSRTPTDM